MNVSRFGVYIGSSCDLPEECHRRHRVQRVWYNDMYDVCRHSHDIAVIELEDTIEASEAVPICMPTEQSQLAEQLQAAGSGVDPSLDIDMYGKYRRKVKVVGLTLSSEDSHTKMIHVRARDASLCQGDSGGPLFQLDDRMRSTVVGVASYGPRCLYAPQGVCPVEEGKSPKKSSEPESLCNSVRDKKDISSAAVGAHPKLLRADVPA
ncbi:hypothetical protein TELCIR_00089 [Teladorsagia circumcincta]|uniref:Peptidase S1 domain-containing protein n=1 Tax=Teladorsagia circumcincta TaxID=45464 RepID=A0A2G9V5N4_TELCI|nr:hypothetical protein TELCIR_00089 [Teladorsagia circumcincta]